MKTIMKITMLMATILFVGTTLSAQNCNSKTQSWAVKTANGDQCVKVNYDDNDGNLTMTMNFPREKTETLKKYLEKELGKNYTTHTGDLQRWTNLKNTKSQGFKTSISNGYVKVTYTGGDEDVLEEVKALVRELKHQVCNEKKGK